MQKQYYSQAFISCAVALAFVEASVLNNVAFTGVEDRDFSSPLSILFDDRRRNSSLNIIKYSTFTNLKFKLQIKRVKQVQ